MRLSNLLATSYADGKPRWMMFVSKTIRLSRGHGLIFLIKNTHHSNPKYGGFEQIYLLCQSGVEAD